MSNLLASHNIYTQFWQLDQLAEQKQLEETYFIHNHPLIGIFIDFNCNKSKEVLNKASEESLYKRSYHWLIYDENSSYQKFRSLVEHYNLSVDADVTYVHPENGQRYTSSLPNSSFMLYDIFNNGYALGGKLNISKDRVLECNEEHCKLKGYLSNLHEYGKYEYRWLLDDITMRVSTVVTYLPTNSSQELLLQHLLSEKDHRIDAIARFGFNYIQILRDVLQCRYVYNFTGTWSSTEVSGGQVGAIGQEQSADIGSSPFLASIARYKYVRPIVKLGAFRQACIFRTPRNAGIRGDVYLEPFSFLVWIFFFAILVLISLILWLTFVVERRQLKIYLAFMPSLLTTSLISFGSACCQGSWVVPSALGGRIAFFLLSLLSFLIYNYYTSIVVAILLGSPVKSNIKTIGQLADSNLDVALEPIAHAISFFNFSRAPEIRRFVRNKIKSHKNPDDVWMPIVEGLRRVRVQPGFVYGTEAYAGYGEIERTYKPEEICDLNEVLLRPVQFLYTHLSKKSPYLEFMRIKQIRILESGIHQQLANKWVKTRLNCDMNSGILVQVGLEYTAPLFIMMAVAYGTALLLLCAEKMWKELN